MVIIDATERMDYLRNCPKVTMSELAGIFGIKGNSLYTWLRRAWVHVSNDGKVVIESEMYCRPIPVKKGETFTFRGNKYKMVGRLHTDIKCYRVIGSKTLTRTYVYLDSKLVAKALSPENHLTEVEL